MPTTVVARSAAASRSAASSLVLRRGASGSAVTTLQNALRRAGYAIPVDGDFGARTLAAVRAFQRRSGLPVDGVAGPKTLAALNGSARTSPSPVPPARDVAATATTAAGTRVATGYRNGRPTSVRLASVGNGQYLAANAAPRYKQMIAAAKAAGITLTSTSGFRTNAQQAALFRRYGAGRASRPGYSNHQQGLSMDIGGVGGYGTRAFKWLKANAGRFGFVNDVPREHWHWTFKG